MLLKASLLEELIASSHPIIPGAGRPLFAGRTECQPLVLTNSITLTTGLVPLTYQTAR